MEYLIKVSAILVLFYLCYKFLLNRETFFESNRSFLLLGLITAFILPLITISKYITVEPTIIENFYVFNDTMSQPIAVDNSISITTIFTYIYIVGVLFFLGRFLLQFGSLAALLFNSTKQRVASFIYVITKNIISPFSFFKWIVFNPNQFSDTELEQIITHEKVHARQLHSIDILLAELICIILWFNPLVWLYKKDLRQNLEFIADKNAQATTNCKKSYQHLLLKTSVPNYKMALTNNFYNSSIKKRIVMLHKNKSNKRNQLKFLLILPVLVLFLMSFNTKEIYIETKTNTKETSTLKQEVETKATTDNDTETLKTTSNPVTISQKAITSNNTVKSNTILLQDIVTYFIESTFTDDKLDDVTSKLKTHGITLKIKGVKRNSDNEITAIKVDAKSSNSNANFSINNDSAIKTIRITYNAKSNSISIGNTNGLIHDKDYEYTHEDGVITIGKSGKSDNVFVFSSDAHDEDHDVIEHDDKIIIKKGNTVHDIKKLHTDKDKNVFVIVGGEGKTYDIIHADSLHSDGEIYKLKGNVVVKGKNSGLFVTSENDHLKIKKDKDGNSILIRKDKDGNIIEEKISNKNNNLSFKSEDGNLFKIRSTGTNSNIWVDKDENVNSSSVNLITKGYKKIVITDKSDKNLVYIVDGKEVKIKKIKDIDSDKIKSVNVIKGEAATKKYGKKAKDGVVEITTKDNMNSSIINLSNNNEKPLIIVDGKEVKNKKLKDIDVDTIESINVLKGESAEKKYGKKGKDGVIEITLKKKKD